MTANDTGAPAMTTQMKQEHTPLPWETRDGHYQLGKHQVWGNGSLLADCCQLIGNEECEANAAHIVHCVNTHEALKASHDKKLRALQAAYRIIEETCPHYLTEEDDGKLIVDALAEAESLS